MKTEQIKIPDITLCEGTECPLKEQCYLYRAIPSEFRQSYFAEIPYKDGQCEHFIQITDFHMHRVKKNDDPCESPSIH